MKKIITMIVLALGITATTQAQKKDMNHKKDDFTIKQKTELAVKKMALKLDLTDSQMLQITPLLKEKIEKRTEMRTKRKASKEKSGERKGKDNKMTSDKRFEMANKKLDEKIAFKKGMKSILNPAQYEKFEKMATHRKGKKGRKGNKNGKGKKKGKDTSCEKKSCHHKE